MSAPDDLPLDQGTDVRLQHATTKVEAHVEVHGEIEARAKKLQELQESGQALIAQGQPGIQRYLKELETATNTMKSSWPPTLAQ